MNVVDPGLKEWATETQKQYIDLINEMGSVNKAAKKLGKSPGTLANSIHGLRSRAAKQGYAPDAAMYNPVPEPFYVKGMSVLRNAANEVVMTWQKTSIAEEQRAALIMQVLREQAEEIPRLKPVPSPSGFLKGSTLNPNLLNVYTMTDCHMGMLAWDKECGEDWDLQIAEKTLTGCFQAMLSGAPPAKECVVAQLGDFLHYDSFRPVTPTSGHLLDADSRFPKLVSSAVRVLRGIVDMALAKHDMVYVLMAEGNHDIASSVWLRTIFGALYEKEPRVKMIHSENPYYAMQWGKVMLGWHHGHMTQIKGIPLLMAAQFPEIWGKTKARYVHMGDKHHTEEKEYSGIMVVQHPTLAARDAYAARYGYMAMRRATAITYHREYGETGRTTVLPEMITP